MDKELQDKAASPRETTTLKERHEIRKGWFLTEASRQSANRARMARCEAMYDNEQYTHEAAQEIRDRGQVPVTYNEIKPVIDWLIGTERRSRVDFYVVPETDDPGADEDAQNKTQLLKYLDDTNKASFERSESADSAFKAGLGWIEVGLRGDKNGPPILIGSENWRNILWDSLASKKDLSDARYLFRIKVVDLDVALALFPGKKEQLERCVQTGDQIDVFREWLGGNGLIAGLDDFKGATDDPLDYSTSRPVDLFNTRKRVLLIECWSREPQANAEPSPYGIADPITMKVRCSIMTEHDTLLEAWSPYPHDRFPFIPVWAYRNRRTGLPYSPIWPLIGPQEALNDRMSKALFEASSNQIEIELGAWDDEAMDLDALRREYNDPNGMPVLKAGALSGGKVRVREHQAAASAQLALAERDAMTIRAMSGVTADNQGRNSNVISGKAVLAKQDQGSLLTAELFDNILFARQLEGEQTLSMAEHFIKAPMVVRVAGDGGMAKFMKLNQPLPDGTYANDITARRAYFSVGEQPWKQTYAEASFESLMQVMSQLAAAAPQVVINLLDVVFEMHPNLPRKQQLLERIRKLNGQSDPSGKLTPEQQAEQQKAKQQAEERYRLEMDTLIEELNKAKATGAKLNAEAVNARLTTIYEAAQAALVLAQTPGTAPIADELLRSVGFEDAGGGPVIDVQPQPVTPVDPGLQPAPDQGMQMLPELQQSDGAQQGIETPAADGAAPFQPM